MQNASGKPKAILICGKICSGKSYYAEKLRRELPAAVLSCDELMLSLFDEYLGDRHQEISRKAEDYLLQRAAELLEIGISVILDWGFWTGESRTETERFFRDRGFETQWHYLEIDDATWRKNMENRNREKPENAYFVDENLAKKCLARFQPPSPEEMDLWIDHSRA